MTERSWNIPGSLVGTVAPALISKHCGFCDHSFQNQTSSLTTEIIAFPMVGLSGLQKVFIRTTSPQHVLLPEVSGTRKKQEYGTVQNDIHYLMAVKGLGMTVLIILRCSR